MFSISNNKISVFVITKCWIISILWSFVTALSNENRVFIVRHGQSHPNVAGRIVSAIENGIKKKNGLTTLGLSQAKDAGKQLYQKLIVEDQLPKEKILILTSPFSRAKETAEEIQKFLGCDLKVEGELKERWFGEWDQQSDAYYNKVWAEDEKNSRHTEFNVESVQSVANRMTGLLRNLDEKCNNDSLSLILVSHGDALQILQTALLGKDLRFHRSLPHLNNCEVREVLMNNI